MFLEIGGVGVRVPGRLGAIEGWLRIGCVHGLLGASNTPAALPLEAAGPLWGQTVLFPFEASPGPRPHPQLMLFDLHLFLHGHAK